MSESKLVPLNFSICEMCGYSKQLELGVHISDFDKSKLGLCPCKFNPSNYDMLYDGKKFCLFFNAFNGKIKKSRCFEQELWLKVEDGCVSLELYEIFWHIRMTLEKLLNKTEKCLSFIEWNKIWLDYCDEDLVPRNVYRFEEASVAIDNVLNISEDKFTKQFRLKSELIDAHVILPGKT